VSRAGVVPHTVSEGIKNPYSFQVWKGEAMKAKNPRDATERNVKASRARDEKLLARIWNLQWKTEQAVKNLQQRVKALEKAKE
jgi:hypothetical protein